MAREEAGQADVQRKEHIRLWKAMATFHCLVLVKTAMLWIKKPSQESDELDHLPFQVCSILGSWNSASECACIKPCGFLEGTSQREFHLWCL